VAYIARKYAEAGEFGKLRKEVPLPGGILRFPGLRGLQQAIGSAAALYERLQPAPCVLEKLIRALALDAHCARSVLREDVRNMLSVMSALPILCYHNVALAPPEARFKLLYVSPDKFERQLWTLRRLGLRGVSMGEGIARLRNGSARGRVAFTFDDGYADTLTAAAPLMKRYGFGATSYIVSGALGTYNRWDAQYLQETKPLMSRQLSWPVTVIGLIGLAVGALGNDWRQRWLIAVGAVPMLGIGLLAAFWFPRYLLFTLPPLIVASASGWRGLALRAGRFRHAVQFGVLAVCVGFMGRQSALIILEPAAARWSPLDRFQYFEGWPSGYGYPEAAKFVLDTPGAPSTIYSLDGHSAYQLLTYLPAAWIGRVKPVFYGRDGEVLRSEDARLENLLGRMPVWIIVSEQLLQGYLDSSFGRISNHQINLRGIAAFDKPGSRSRLAIYEVARR